MDPLIFWPLVFMIGFILGTAFGAWRTEYYYLYEKNDNE